MLDAHGQVNGKPSPTHNAHVGQSPHARPETPSVPSVEEQAELAGIGPKGPTRAAPKQRSDNAARSRRQAASSRTVVDGAGSVRKPRATTLMVPEEKRCEALTTLGARCKAPRLRGLKVCMFHGHLANDDERLAALADPLAHPPLSPRKALKAVAAIRAGEIAVSAVAGALAKAPDDGGRALLALVEAVDPVEVTTTTMTLSTPSDVDGLSFAQLTQAVRSLTPSNGSVEPNEATRGEESGLPLIEANEA